MSSPATTPETDSPRLRDDTTRFLCGAAHHNEEFADSAIREYLVEPARAIPRSPGVNTGAVLREAVAGRTRRKARDIMLLVLTIMVLFVASGKLLGLWLLAGAAVAIAAGARIRPGKRAQSVSPHMRVPLLLGAIASSIAMFLVLYKLTSELDEPTYRPNSRARYEQESSDDVGLVITIIGILLIFGVLLADRVVVWLLVTKSFRRTAFRTSASEEELFRNEWKIRRLGHSNYANSLRLHPEEDSEPADTGRPQVIVYHGYRPFVGSGTMFEPWSMALPLKPDEDAKTDKDVPRPGFVLSELYEHVTNELVKTGRSPSLSPGHRLRELTTGDRVVVSAVELIDHIDDEATRLVLPNRDSAPVQTVDQSVVDDLVARPMEWMRYFRSFQLETWDRDVVVSAYLTFGLDEEMLYVEWTPCILHPIVAEHRNIDTMPEQSLRPLADAFVDLLRFPTTLPKRFATALNWMTPLYQADGTFVAEKYGAKHSLRELAGGHQVDNYFQLTDVERYIKVLESRLLRTMGEFLQSKGISVTEFMEQAMQVTNNNVHITGPVISSNIATAGRARAGNTGTNKEKP